MTTLREKAVELTCELVRIKSENPPGGERLVAEFLSGYLEKHGIKSDVVPIAEGRANLIAVLKGKTSDKKLLYQGHIDVVPANASDWSVPPYAPLIKGGRLYGRGGADMKSGVAAMTEAAIWLKQNDIPLQGDLILGFVADEEVANRGIKKMLEDGLRANFCVISEPTSLDIVLGHRGVLTLEVVFQGRAVHAAQAHSGVNAIEKAMKFVAAAYEFQKRTLSGRNHPMLGKSTLNVCVIEGGEKVNIIPDRCRLELDRRLIPNEDKGAALQEIQEILELLAQEDPHFQATWKMITYCPPSQIASDTEIVQCLREAATEILGKTPQEKGFKATCEASLMQERGIPSVVFGPGNIDQAHNVDEFVDVEEIGKAAEIFVLLAKKVLR